MNFEIVTTEPFDRKIKRLAKKHKSIKKDLAEIIEALKFDPFIGKPLGKDCFKIRMAITSKGKGKSGGARLITYIRVVAKTVYLINIYDKGEQETITDKELKLLVDALAP